jgi:hypothetical protein
VDFVGGEQMAMFAVTETTLWTMEMPESLAERGCFSLTLDHRPRSVPTSHRGFSVGKGKR